MGSAQEKKAWVIKSYTPLARSLDSGRPKDHSVWGCPQQDRVVLGMEAA